MIRTEHKQDEKKLNDNQSENSDENVRQFWCDKGVDVVSKTN